MNQLSLYQRLGGYQAISRFANNLLPRLKNDSHLGRFWKNSNSSNLSSSKNSNGLIKYLCFYAGWSTHLPQHNVGSLNITELDWTKFMVHAGATMEALQVPTREAEEIISFAISMKNQVVRH
ncbi:MAG: hypothetical protein L3J39_15315 [Verrucomicrobiales bacterium]|nr:hypothetical protein [Verrucomicrobiales bacterium]